MSAVWIRFRSELHSRWRSWLALALLVGLTGGLVLAVAAGARRTDSAVERFLTTTLAADVTVAKFPEVSDIDLDRVERLPQVADAGRVVGFPYWGRTGKGRMLPAMGFGLDALAPVDGRWAREIDRPRIVSGRDVDANRIDEVVVGSNATERFGLSVGSTLRLRFLTVEELGRFNELSAANDPVRLKAEFPLNADPASWRAGPLVTFRVVGIFADASPKGVNPSMNLSRAFYEAHRRTVASWSEFATIRLERGAADRAAFAAGVERLPGGTSAFVFSQDEFLGKVQRSIHLQAQALWVVAILGALAVLLILAQALTRQAVLESAEYPTLRALGMARGQLFGLTMARAALTGAVSAVVAVAVAVALSPLMPVGTARTAEPDPGRALDGVVLGTGAGAIIGLVLLVAAIPAWRTARAAGRTLGVGFEPAGREVRRSSAADLFARAGFPPSAVVGVRMALERGRGRTAVPVRATLLGAVAAVAVVAAAVTFGASLDHLVKTPRLYGQSWDVVAGDFTGTDVGDKLVSSVAGDRSVAGLAVGTTADATIGGKRAGVLAVDVVKGAVSPVVVEGLAPSGSDEILLGTKTLRALGAELGDVVQVEVGKRSTPMRVVGRGALPEITDLKQLGLGNGAAMTLRGLRRLVPDAGRSLLLIRSAAGADAEEELGHLFYTPQLGGVREPTPPSHVDDFGGVDSMPYVIIGLFGMIAAAALLHMLVTVIRRRRRDLAILKTLGFTRLQVLATVAWQATTVAAVALVIGLPLGVAAGRWAWNLFAEQLGVVPEPVTPISTIVLAVPATILLANLIAVLPGRIAARTRPAVVLRAE